MWVKLRFAGGAGPRGPRGAGRRHVPTVRIWGRFRFLRFWLRSSDPTPPPRPGSLRPSSPAPGLGPAPLARSLGASSSRTPQPPPPPPRALRAVGAVHGERIMAIEGKWRPSEEWSPSGWRAQGLGGRPRRRLGSGRIRDTGLGAACGPGGHWPTRRRC